MSAMSSLTPEKLAERIRDLRAQTYGNPLLWMEHVLAELHCADAFLNAGHLGMAEASYDQAKHYFLAARASREAV
jgi:hypothetical protein